VPNAPFTFHAPARRGSRRLTIGIAIALLLLCVALAGTWFLVTREARQQASAVAQLRNHNVLVMYDYNLGANGYWNRNAVPAEPAWRRWLLGDDFSHHVIAVDAALAGHSATGEPFGDARMQHVGRLKMLQQLLLSRIEVTDAGLAQLRDLCELRSVLLEDTAITDAGLEHLRALTKLEKLDLSGTRLDGSGLIHLRGLTKLRWLGLQSTAIGDDALAHLAGMTQLRQINLSGNRIGDAAMKHLRTLSQLEIITLDSTAVSDRGLKELAGLAQLSHVSLGNTAVTLDGAMELRKALPGTTIVVDRNVDPQDRLRIPGPPQPAQPPPPATPPADSLHHPPRAEPEPMER